MTDAIAHLLCTSLGACVGFVLASLLIMSQRD
jgi:hypothetical protein